MVTRSQAATCTSPNGVLVGRSRPDNQIRTWSLLAALDRRGRGAGIDAPAPRMLAAADPTNEAARANRGTIAGVAHRPRGDRRRAGVREVVGTKPGRRAICK